MKQERHSKPDVETIDNASFHRIVTESARPVIVDFYAPWCGPCRALAPRLPELAEKYEAIVVKVNVDEERALAESYGVRTVPTVVRFDNGTESDRVIGYAALHDLDAALGLV
jgi:thioredoxin 1